MVSLDKFKNTISLLEKNNLAYWVFGGFAFEGIRKRITRDHSDIDIYLSSSDLEKIKKIFSTKEYKFFQRNKMYYVESENLKLGIVLITNENDSIITHGNNTVVQFPNKIWENKNIMQISEISFNCAPNEVLIFDSQFSTHKEDKELVLQLEYDKDLFNQIKVIK